MASSFQSPKHSIYRSLPDLVFCLLLALIRILGNSLVVRWLRLWASTAGDGDQSLTGELRSHKPLVSAKKKKKKKKKKAFSLILHACIHACVHSCVWLFATPWTVACQAPLYMGFPGENPGVGCHVLLQGIWSGIEPESLASPALAY